MCRLTKKWVGHQIQASSLVRSWCFPSYNSTLWSCPWPPTASTVSSWPSGQSEVSVNDLKWLPMPKNIHLNTRTMFLACSEAELEFHSLKCFLTSYSPSTVFVAFRSIWGVWKWSQMIAYAQKHSFGHQNHLSSVLRSWVRISLLEVLHDLLQPLHPVHGLQVNLRPLKIISNDCLCPKTFIWTPEPSF